MSADAQNRLVASACASCHNERSPAGGLRLDNFDAGQIEAQAEIAEKMIQKLRLGMMPPQTVRNRPDAATLDSLATALEVPLDRAFTRSPQPGRRPSQRLTRTEYRTAIRDLLDIDVDTTAFLAPDTLSAGFDNVADVQGLSATALQGYLTAAARIADMALGNANATAAETTYAVPRTQSQMVHIEGTPYGTRGGISALHTFPADGEYVFRMMLHSVPTGQLFGSTVENEQIEVSINGARAAVLTVDRMMRETDPLGMNIVTPRISVKAGQHRVAVAFVQRFESEVYDLLAPIDHSLADTFYGGNTGITSLPHLRTFSITGPFDVTGVSDTPSRERVLSCLPTSANDEEPCARKILERLATKAYRRPATQADVDRLMGFYEEGRREGDFEDGVRLGLRWILASPHFLFRFEEVPSTASVGQTYQISDLAIASRLAFFLWAASPDDELVKAAAGGTLRTPAGLERQVQRMLADPRAETLSTRFASQWLRLQDVFQVVPDPMRFPEWDRLLSESFKRETELLFDSIVREDRNVLDLLRADYTFVNGRTAKHYGVANVTSSSFKRVSLGPELQYRRGILGHGSILLLTSLADRTSPVMRGKWVMEVLLGSPPPPAPPNVPEFEATSVAAEGRLLSVRERLEQHRANPACASCHRVIDPLGLTLETFDAIGRWRIKDSGSPVDAKGELYDGTQMDGPGGLREALLSRSEVVLRNFTVNLMTYALGRRVEYFDQPTVRVIVREAAAKDYRFSSFVLGIVNSPAFQMSQMEERTEAPDR